MYRLKARFSDDELKIMAMEETRAKMNGVSIIHVHFKEYIWEELERFPHFAVAHAAL